MGRKHKRRNPPKRPSQEKHVRFIVKRSDNPDIILKNGVTDINWVVSESIVEHILENHAYNAWTNKSRFFTNSALTLTNLLIEAVHRGGKKEDASDNSYVLYVKMTKPTGESMHLKRGVFEKTNWLAIRYHYEGGKYRVRTAYPCFKPKR